jgi:hypothetical protein
MGLWIAVAWSKSKGSKVKSGHFESVQQGSRDLNFSGMRFSQSQNWFEFPSLLANRFVIFCRKNHGTLRCQNYIWTATALEEIAAFAKNFGL